MPLAAVDQIVPFQRRIVPPAPTTQTSFAPLPHTPLNDAVVPLFAADQAVPFQCSMAPSSPTAQASCAPLPHTPLRLTVGAALGVSVHRLPLKCRMVPASPTAQASLGLVPHTLARSVATPLRASRHVVPFQ